jgi:hypothetical protein
VAGYAIPGIVVFFFWLVVIILVIILLAFIVHWAGGGVLNLRLGHFELNVGFTCPATTAINIPCGRPRSVSAAACRNYPGWPRHSRGKRRLSGRTA